MRFLENARHALMSAMYRVVILVTQTREDISLIIFWVHFDNTVNDPIQIYL